MGKRGLQLLKMLIQAENEKCEMSQGLFKTLNHKFKTQYNETIKPLKFHNPNRQANESTEEWIGKLKIAIKE